MMIQINKKDLLPLVARYLPADPIIVEAGAFDGRDTQRLASFWPCATLHAFEPVPTIFELLRVNTQALPNVHCYSTALSDVTATATLYVSEHPERPGKPCQAGSLLQPHERLALSPITYPTTITVPTITLDDWAKATTIDRVDFAWLDMQGYELNVLKASPRMLATMQVIYTEVEFMEAYKDQYLYADVRQWLEAHGFTMIAKDFSDNPTWFFGNALFVRD